MITTVILTNHAYIRAKERFGYGRSIAKKTAQFALQYGTLVRKYTACIANEKVREHTFKILFHKKCFIFNKNNVCITMYRFSK